MGVLGTRVEDALLTRLCAGHASLHRGFLWKTSVIVAVGAVEGQDGPMAREAAVCMLISRGGQCKTGKLVRTARYYRVCLTP